MDLIVVDASAIVDYVLQLPASPRIRREIERADGVGVPQHFDLEAASAIRKLEHLSVIDDFRSRRALRQVVSFRARRHALRPLMPQIWRLSHNMTVYDAAYVALAVTIDATLVTTDRKLAATPGIEIPITVC